MSFGRKIMSVFTLAIAIVAFNTFATAQETTKDTDKKSVERQERKQGRFGREGKRGKGGKHGMRGDQGLMRSFRGLDLTDAQKDQIKTLMQTNRTANQPLHEEARTLMMKRRDGTITEAEQTRLGDIKNEMKNSSEQLKNSVLGILTPEQTQKLEQMKAERQQRMEERRQLREQNKQKRSEEPTKTEDN